MPLTLDARDLEVLQTGTTSPPSISAVADDRATYANGLVPAWSPISVTFQVATAATNPYEPYAASTPAGVTAARGITADVEWSSDLFATVLAAPAWYGAPHDHLTHADDANVPSGQDWLYPTTSSCWTARFEPPAAGAWQYRVRVTDRNGTTATASSAAITVVASTAKGHIRVSQTDHRYLAYADGTLAWPIGYNGGDGLGDDVSDNTSVDIADGQQGNRTMFAAMASAGVNFMRWWVYIHGVFNAGGSPWLAADYGGGILAPLSIEGRTADTGSNSEIVWKLNNAVAATRAMQLGRFRRTPPVKPSTVYRARVRYQIPTALQSANASPAGLCLKTSTAVQGLINASASGTGTVLTNSVTGTGGAAVRATAATGIGWATLVGYFATGSTQRTMDAMFHVALENVSTSSGGQIVYIDRVDIEETDGAGNIVGPNICPAPDADQHTYPSEYFAASLDLMIREAEANAIALKLVLATKGDPILALIATDGTYQATATEARFYGDSTQTVCKNRWHLRAQWRYYQARWGYSSAIHTWELLNEGNPFDGPHAALARMFGDYLGRKAGQFANPHLTTTSCFGFDSPRIFWNDAGVGSSTGGVDYCDIHMYLPDPSTYVGTVLARSDSLSYDGSNATSYTAYADDPLADFDDYPLNQGRIGAQLGANGSQGLSVPLMRGETGLSVASNDTDHPAAIVSSDTSLNWLHGMLWGQLHDSGFMDPAWWYDKTFLYDRSDGSPNNLPKFQPFAQFIAQLASLANGHFAAAGATVPTGLRATGQKDATNGLLYLWIDNTQHRWIDVVNGVTPTARSGNVVASGLPNGTYTVSWYDPYVSGSTPSSTATATASAGTLTLALPAPVSTDVAMIAALQGGGTVTGGRLAPASAALAAAGLIRSVPAAGAVLSPGLVRTVTASAALQVIAQVWRPAAVVSAGSWSAVGTATIPDALDETVPSDSDYAQSSAGPSSDALELSGPALGNPGVTTGHVVRYRYERNTGDTPITLVVTLLCGATTIATWTHTSVIAAFVQAQQTLTTGQAAAITDYADLRLRFTATEAP